MCPAKKETGGLDGQDSGAVQRTSNSNRSLVNRWSRKKRRAGVTAIEYALVLSLLSMFVIVGVQQFGEMTSNLLMNSAVQLKSIGPGQKSDKNTSSDDDDDEDHDRKSKKGKKGGRKKH